MTNVAIIEASHDLFGDYRLYCEGADDLLFTENESNAEAPLGRPEPDAIRQRLYQQLCRSRTTGAVNPARIGTKAAAHYRGLTLRPAKRRVNSAAPASKSTKLENHPRPRSRISMTNAFRNGARKRTNFTLTSRHPV